MRKVYIDCGSNKTGVTRRFINEGNRDYEFYLFEPLPLFKDMGKQLQLWYPDIKFHYHEKAVWTENTELKFYICGRGNEGSSLCENK